MLRRELLRRAAGLLAAVGLGAIVEAPGSAEDDIFANPPEGPYEIVATRRDVPTYDCVYIPPLDERNAAIWNGPLPESGAIGPGMIVRTHVMVALMNGASDASDRVLRHVPAIEPGYRRAYINVGGGNTDDGDRIYLIQAIDIEVEPIIG